MHALLISGGTKDKRNAKIQEIISEWKISKHDQIRLQSDTSIGITAIKEYIGQSKLKPQYSLYRVGIIEDAEHMTVEAQNALLKTLEEPPPHTRIILETANENLLLPTIISRCFQKNIKNPIPDIQPNESENLLSLYEKSPGNIIVYIDKTITSRDDAIQMVMILISQLSQKTQEVFKKNAIGTEKAMIKLYAERLRKAHQALLKLQSNVSYKPVLDFVFIP